MKPITLRHAARYPLITLLALGGPWACSGNVNIIDGTSSGGSKSGGAKSSGGDSSLAGETSSGGERASGGKSSAGGDGEATGGRETSDGGADATGGRGATSGGTSSGGAGSVDECDLNTDNCDSNATCTNTSQSFTCMCNSGYTGTGTETNCLDIDECQTGAHDCSPQANCTNTNGSFGCACRKGYTGSGQQCTDIDECQTGANDCSAQADCENTTGSFSCECKSGYTGSGQQCTDIDECNIGTDNCNAHATCNNKGGSFGCVCNTPYFGDGVTCTCRTKSSTNVIVKGGLDTSASVGSAGGAIWSNDNGGSWVSNQDAESCSDSGALQLVDTTTKIYATTTICVPVTPSTTYYLGLKYKRTEGGKFACQPVYYSQPGCSSGVGYGEPTISIDRATSDDANWLSVASSAGTSPSNAQSAVLYCRSELASNDPMSATWVWLDQIYFNSSSAKF